MKAIKFFLCLCLFSLPLFVKAQNTETRQLPSFNKLHVGGSWDVVMEKGDKESVRLVGKNIDLQNVITEVKNNKLNIYLEKGNYRNFDLTVYVTYRDLNEVHKSGSGNLSNKSDLSAGDFNLHLSGSGNTELNNITADKLEVHLSGSGNLNLGGGNVKKLSVNQSGSGNIKSSSLQAHNCSIRKSGSGNVEINVSETLEVESSGSGNIKYRGNPAINKVRFSGSGELVKI